MADSDGTLIIDADVPAFTKQIEEMASKSISIFSKVGNALKGVFGMSTPTTTMQWSQSPMARSTKEWGEQVKAAREMNKLERERSEIKKAERYRALREKHGENASFTYGGRVTEEEEARKNRTKWSRRVAGAAGMYNTWMNSGGSAQGQVQMGAQLGSMLASAFGAPEFAQAISAVAGVIVDSLNVKDKVREAYLTLQQSGGDYPLRLATNEGFTSRRIDQLGYTQQQFANLYAGTMRAGGFGNSAARGIDDLMIGGNSFAGVAQSGSRLFGGLAKQDQNFDTHSAFGTAMALALKEGLNKARVYEAFDQLTKALDENAFATNDLQSTANRFSFISSMGQQYKGNTAAANQVNQGLQGIVGGSTPYNRMIGMIASGYGKPGVSAFDAMMKMQTGLDKVGGVAHDQVLHSLFYQFRKYSELPNAVAILLSQQTGIAAPVLKDMFKAAKKGYPNVEPNEGIGYLNANVPNKDLIQPRINAAKAEGRGLTTADVLTNITSGKLSFDQSIETQGNGGVTSASGAPASQATPTPTSARTTNAGWQSYVMQGFHAKDPKSKGGLHNGVDLALPGGSAIYAPCDGMVRVAIHASGVEVGATVSFADGSYVSHVVPSTLKVKDKQVVKRGDLIGYTSKSDFKDGGGTVKSHAHIGLLDRSDPTARGDAFMNSFFSGPGGMQTVPTATRTGSIVAADAAKQSTPKAQPLQVAAVPIVIRDKTQHGIDVEAERQHFDRQAGAPAPGDAPSLVNPF